MDEREEGEKTADDAYHGSLDACPLTGPHLPCARPETQRVSECTVCRLNIGRKLGHGHSATLAECRVWGPELSRDAVCTADVTYSRRQIAERDSKGRESLTDIITRRHAYQHMTTQTTVVRCARSRVVSCTNGVLWLTSCVRHLVHVTYSTK